MREGLGRIPCKKQGRPLDLWGIPSLGWVRGGGVSEGSHDADARREYIRYGRAREKGEAQLPAGAPWCVNRSNRYRARSQHARKLPNGRRLGAKGMRASLPLFTGGDGCPVLTPHRDTSDTCLSTVSAA